MIQDPKENPYVKLTRTGQERDRKVEGIVRITDEIAKLQSQIDKKTKELQELNGEKTEIDKKLKNIAKEIAEGD